MASAISERRLGELSEPCARATSDQELLEDVSTRLREVVPFDGAAWFATDPATVLATSPVRIENVETGHCESYWELVARLFAEHHAPVLDAPGAYVHVEA